MTAPPQHPVVQELLDVLAKYGATINSTCQTGCELDVRVGNETVAE